MKCKTSAKFLHTQAMHRDISVDSPSICSVGAPGGTALLKLHTIHMRSPSNQLLYMHFAVPESEALTYLHISFHAITLKSTSIRAWKYSH